MLSQALGRLFAVAEAYPDLKANQNFLDLQAQLQDTENKIAVSRQVYNDTVLTYNNAIQVFPAVLIAGSFHFTKREFFEIEAPADRDVPVVSFQPDASAPAAPAAPAPAAPPAADALEAPGEEDGREDLDRVVVGQNGVVVDLARRGDLVPRVCQLRLQLLEVLVRLQFWVGLGDCEQLTERLAEHVLRLRCCLEPVSGRPHPPPALASPLRTSSRSCDA